MDKKGKRKRRHEEDEDHIKRKIKKLQKQLGNFAKSPTVSPRPESPAPQLLQSPLPALGTDAAEQDLAKESHATDVTVQELDIDEDHLPEEFLLALGCEGEDTMEVGEAIRAELALRWSNIMNNGLGKEARENILKKYPTPQNFSRAVAPVLNPEIEASVSELTLKRDKRIVNRQNMTGKMMSSLGKALTCIIKGEINTKSLIELVNDAAKIAADVFYQDSTSRKFFALAGATPVVKEAVRTENTDEFLFGKGCSEKIKAAQAIHKTGSQIKSSDTSMRPKNMNPTPKVQGNWKGPSRYQQHQQQRGTRGGHRQQPPMKRNFNQHHHRQKEHKHYQPRSRTNYRR